MLRLLRCLDHRRFVEITLVVNVELAESILQAKDLPLLELGVFPARKALLAVMEARGVAWQTAATYFCSLMIFMAAVRGVCAESWDLERRDNCGKVSAWLSLVLCCAFDGRFTCLAYPDDVGRTTAKSGCVEGQPLARLRPDYVRTICR